MGRIRDAIVASHNQGAPAPQVQNQPTTPLLGGGRLQQALRSRGQSGAAAPAPAQTMPAPAGGTAQPSGGMFGSVGSGIKYPPGAGYGR